MASTKLADLKLDIKVNVNSGDASKKISSLDNKVTKLQTALEKSYNINIDDLKATSKISSLENKLKSTFKTKIEVDTTDFNKKIVEIQNLAKVAASAVQNISIPQSVASAQSQKTLVNKEIKNLQAKRNYVNKQARKTGESYLEENLIKANQSYTVSKTYANKVKLAQAYSAIQEFTNGKWSTAGKKFIKGLSREDLVKRVEAIQDSSSDKLQEMLENDEFYSGVDKLVKTAEGQIKDVSAELEIYNQNIESLVEVRNALNQRISDIQNMDDLEVKEVEDRQKRIEKAKQNIANYESQSKQVASTKASKSTKVGSSVSSEASNIVSQETQLSELENKTDSLKQKAENLKNKEKEVTEILNQDTTSINQNSLSSQLTYLLDQKIVGAESIDENFNEQIRVVEERISKIKELESKLSSLESGKGIAFSVADLASSYEKASSSKKNLDIADVLYKYNNLDSVLEDSKKYGSLNSIFTKASIEKYVAKNSKKAIVKKAYDSLDNNYITQVKKQLETEVNQYKKDFQNVFDFSQLGNVSNTEMAKTGIEASTKKAIDTSALTKSFEEIQQLTNQIKALSVDPIKLNIELSPTIEEIKSQLAQLTTNEPIKLNIESGTIIEDLKTELNKLTTSDDPIKLDADLSSSIEELRAELNKLSNTEEPVNILIKTTPSIEELRAELNKLVNTDEPIAIHTKLKPTIDELKAQIQLIGEQEIPLKINTKSFISQLDNVSKSINEGKINESLKSITNLAERLSPAFENVNNQIKAPKESLQELESSLKSIASLLKKIGVSNIKDAEKIADSTKQKDSTTKKTKSKKKSVSKDSLEQTEEELKEQLLQKNFRDVVKKSGLEGIAQKEMSFDKDTGLYSFIQQLETATGGIRTFKYEFEDLNNAVTKQGSFSEEFLKTGKEITPDKDLITEFKSAASKTYDANNVEATLTSKKSGVTQLTAEWKNANGQIEKYIYNTNKLSDLKSFYTDSGTLDISKIKKEWSSNLSMNDLKNNLLNGLKGSNIEGISDIQLNSFKTANDGYALEIQYLNQTNNLLEKRRILLNNIKSITNEDGSLNKKAFTNSDSDELQNSLISKLSKKQEDRLNKLTEKAKDLSDGQLTREGVFKNTISEEDLSKIDEANSLLEKLENSVKKVYGDNGLLNKLNNPESYDSDEINSELTNLNDSLSKIQSLKKQLSTNDNFVGLFSGDDLKETSKWAELISKNLSKSVDDLQILKAGENGATIQYSENGVKKTEKYRASQLKDLKNAFRVDKIDASSEAMTSVGEHWVDNIKKKISSLTQYFTAQDVVLYAKQAFTEGLSFVREFDASLTTINETMSTSQSQLKKLGQAAIDYGAEVGASAEDVMSAATIYANANDDAEGVIEKSKPTVLLANASGSDISTAADQIQGVTQQFAELEGQETRIVNSYEKISANLAIDFQSGIESMAEGVQTAGSVAESAGMSFETFAASVGKVAEKTRSSGSTIGNAYKSILARISRSKSADEDVSDDDRSNASKAFGSIGISLYNNKGEYKDINETLDELAEKWDTMTDAQRNYIAEQAAGTRNINMFNAIMSTWKDAESLASDALSDSTFYEEVQEKHMDSLEAKLNSLGSTLNNFWYNFWDTDALNAGVDGLNTFLTAITALQEGLNKIGGGVGGDLFGLLLGGSATGVLGSAWDNFTKIRKDDALKYSEGSKNLSDISFTNQLGRAFKQSINDFKTTGLKKSVVSEMAEGEDVKNTFSVLISKFKEGKQALIDSVPEGQVVSKWDGIKAGITSASGALSTFTKISLGIGAAFVGFKVISTVFDAVTTSADEAQEALEKASSTYSSQTSALKENKTTLESIQSEWSSLASGVNLDNNENISLTSDEYERFLDLNNQIAEILPSTVSGYDAQGNAITNLTGKVSELNSEYSKLASSEAQSRINENADTYKQSAKQATGKVSIWDKIATRFSGKRDYDDVYGSQSALEALEKLKSASKSDLKNINQYMGDVTSSIDELDNLRAWMAELSYEDYKSLSSFLGKKSFFSDEDWDQFNEFINSEDFKQELAKQKQAVKEKANSYKELLSDYITTFTEGNGDFSKVDKNLVSSISDMLINTPNKVLNNIESNGDLASFAKKYLRVLTKNGIAKNAFNTLTSLNSDTSLSDANAVLSDRLNILSEALGEKKSTIVKQLGLSDISKAVSAYEDLLDDTDDYNKKLKISNKGLKDAKDNIKNFINKNKINTKDEVNLLKSLMSKYDSWTDVVKNWGKESALNIDTDSNISKLENLKSHIDEVSEAIENINNSKSESNSSSGVQEENIDKLKSMFSELEGYDADKLFEQTYSGVHLNQRELSKLQSQYEKTEYNKYTSQVSELSEQYTSLCQAIAETSDATEKQQLIDKKNTIKEQIEDAKEYQSVIEGQMNAVTKWQNATSYTTMDSIVSGYDSAKELFDAGWIGDETFQSFAQMFTNKDLSGSTSDVYESVFANNQARMQRYLTEDRTGINNFIQDIASSVESAQGMIKGNSVDFTKMPSVKTLAEAMDLSEGFVNEMFKQLNKAGADLDYSEEADYLRQSREKAVEANKFASSYEQLNEASQGKEKTLETSLSNLVSDANELEKLKTFKFDLDMKDPDALKDQISQAEKLKEALIDTFGSGSDEVANFDTQLDYLKASYGETQESVSSEERLNTIVNKLNATKNKKIDGGANIQEYATENAQITIDIEGGKSVQYYKNEIDELSSALQKAEANGEIDMTINSDDYTNARAGLQLLIDKEHEIQTNDVKVNIDTSTLSSDCQQVYNDFLTLQEAVQSLDSLNQLVKAGVTIDDSELEEAQTKVDEAFKTFQENNNGDKGQEIIQKLGLNIDVDEEGADKARKKIQNAVKKITSSSFTNADGENTIEKDINITANAGGNATKKLADISKKLETIDGKSVIATVSAKVNGDTDKVTNVSKALKNVPEKKETDYTLNTTGDLTKVTKATTAVKNAPEEKETNYTLNATGDLDKVNKVASSIKSIPESKESTVTATTSGTKKVNNLGNALGRIVNKAVTATASVSGIQKAQNLANAIAAIKSKSVTITTTYNTVGSPSSGGSSSKGKNGKGSVHGTAHASGTAYAGGKWGSPKSGRSLVGELGREIIVRGSNWFTVGDNGAEMVDIREDDIIFNHKQSDEILKNGFVSSNGGRGKMANAHGNAFGNGTWDSGSGRWNIYTGASNRNPIISTASSSGSSSSGSGDDADEFLETMDWIEIKIQRLEDAIDDLDTKASSAYKKYSERNSTLGEEFTRITEEIQLQQDAYNAYIQKANSIALSEDYKNKVRDGLLSIEDITDENLKDLIDDFQEW